NLDPETLANALMVWIETIVDEQQTDLLPLLRLMETRPRPLLPTAAHPRAYRGTKTQLPKTKQPTLTDLAPALCDRRSVGLVMAKSRDHWQEISPRLEQRGYDAGLLEASLSGADLYLSVYHGASAVAASSSLPESFCRWLLPALQGCPWPVVAEYLALYWQLD